jgi:hypothetical protein
MKISKFIDVAEAEKGMKEKSEEFIEGGKRSMQVKRILILENRFDTSL